MILHRGAGQADALIGFQFTGDAGGTGAGIANILRLIENEHGPVLAFQGIAITLQ